MAIAIKVLMMGGCRYGKTTALASTFDQIINGPVKDYFTVADKTDYTTKESDNGPEKQDVLNDVQLGLESRLEIPTEDFFILDSKPTCNEWTYTLQLKVPGTRNSMNIEFTDVPGEWFAPRAGDKIDKNSGKLVREILTNRISDTDVFVVMVDTPYLMHENESIANAANSIAGIHDYLAYIGDKKEFGVNASNSVAGTHDYLPHIYIGEKGKLVIFSPIKCEKWVKEGKMDEVVKRLKEMYATTLNMLKAFPMMNICIIPIETAGNILFYEYSEPLLLAEANSSQCKKINDSMVRLDNGDIYFLKGNETFNPDPEAFMPGNVIRPYCWYHINPQPVTPHLYAPYNCEQIPLHIVDFMLKKLIREYPRRIEGWIWDERIGGISKKTLESKLRDMRSRGIIKEDVDHIEYLKRCD